jgi:hypothetical protein
LDFNPDDPASLQSLNTQLQRFGLSLSAVGACPAMTGLTPPAQPGNVVYYARRVPRLLRVSRGTNVIGVIEYETTNCGAGVFDIGDFDWVDSELSLTFAEGVLTEVKVKKPSATEEIVSVPLVVADNILGIAEDLLTVRIQRISSESDLVDAQAKYLTAQATLLQRERELVEAIEQTRRHREQHTPEEDPRDSEDGEGAGGAN